MIDVRRCPVIDIIENENLPVIQQEFSDEVATYIKPASPEKLRGYIDMERAGVMQSIGAFCGEKLIGFVAVLAAKVPRCDAPMAVADGLYVARAYRRTGAGVKLIREAEKYARDIGSPCLAFGTPKDGPLATILPRFGYDLTNIMFTKAV